MRSNVVNFYFSSYGFIRRVVGEVFGSMMVGGSLKNSGNLKFICTKFKGQGCFEYRKS